MNNITIYDIEKKIRLYLETIHPKTSNGFIIRLSDKINIVYERRKSYIATFPLINQQIIEDILNKWSEYALNDILDNYDLTQLFTILSIDPIKISSDQTEINIKYAGEIINPENIIRCLTLDIIEQMNKHMIELYMDNNYPETENYNEIFDKIELDDIYSEYPDVDIYVPLKLSSNDESDIIFYLNATIKTNNHLIDIIDDIRISLNSDDVNEIISYEKEDIVYKFGKNKVLQSFTIITDPQL